MRLTHTIAPPFNVPYPNHLCCCSHYPNQRTINTLHLSNTNNMYILSLCFPHHRLALCNVLADQHTLSKAMSQLQPCLRQWRVFVRKAKLRKRVQKKAAKRMRRKGFAAWKNAYEMVRRSSALLPSVHHLYTSYASYDSIHLHLYCILLTNSFPTTFLCFKTFKTQILFIHQSHHVSIIFPQLKFEKQRHFRIMCHSAYIVKKAFSNNVLRQKAKRAYAQFVIVKAVSVVGRYNWVIIALAL